MTVIAYKDGIIAADRAASRCDTITECQKLFVKGEVVFALHEFLAAAHGMMLWYLDGANPSEYSFPKYKAEEAEDWAGLIVFDKELFEFEKFTIKIPIVGEYNAWGNGREFALGAMAVGATAVEAVCAASKHCAGCGFGVDFVDLSKPLVIKNQRARK